MPEYQEFQTILQIKVLVKRTIKKLVRIWTKKLVKNLQTILTIKVYFENNYFFNSQYENQSNI